MARTQGLQEFLESRAEGPAFLIVFACMIARGAQFYSAGALNLKTLLGRQGMEIFNAVTGLGLAVGGELLFAIAGRSWRSNKREAGEVMTRRGLSKAERLALARHYEGNARIAGLFALIGLGASVAAAFSFMWSANSDHSVFTFLQEGIEAFLLVAIVGFLAIFKESKSQTRDERTTETAYAAVAATREAAGRRIASGAYTAADVRVVARALPRQDRDKFEAALLPDDEENPLWSVKDMLGWLGIAAEDTGATKRRIQRRLAKLYEAGKAVTRDDATGSYRIRRSDVLAHFADEFMSARAPARAPIARPAYAIPATSARPDEAPSPESEAATGDSDTTAPQGRQQAIMQPDALVLTPATYPAQDHTEGVRKLESA